MHRLLFTCLQVSALAIAWKALELSTTPDSPGPLEMISGRSWAEGPHPAAQGAAHLHLGPQKWKALAVFCLSPDQCRLTSSIAVTLYFVETISYQVFSARVMA